MIEFRLCGVVGFVVAYPQSQKTTCFPLSAPSSSLAPSLPLSSPPPHPTNTHPAPSAPSSLTHSLIRAHSFFRARCTYILHLLRHLYRSCPSLQVSRPGCFPCRLVHRHAPSAHIPANRGSTCAARCTHIVRRRACVSIDTKQNQGARCRLTERLRLCK